MGAYSRSQSAPAFNRSAIVVGLLFALGVEGKTFKIALPVEPHSLDPIQLSASESQHLFGNLFRGLFRISDSGELIPEGAKDCQWQKSKLICNLADLKFSDGSKIQSKHYVQAFRRFFSSQSHSTEVEHLIRLKNATAVERGQKPPESLGLKAIGGSRLVFEFDQHDPEFMFKLASPVLFPWKDTPPSKEAIYDFPVNGPYKVKQWEKGKRILLTKNEYYEQGHPNRPDVEIFFVQDENTVINLFESNRLDFIRRLPTLSLSKYKKHPGFMARPLSRFDYLGFGPRLQNMKKMREVMTKSLNYNEFQKLFSSLGRPGCPSFPPEYSDRERCYDFDPASRAETPSERFKMLISQAGGEDLKRGAEWFQSQWKKAGISIEIESIEGRIFLNEVKHSKPDIFRMGVPLHRPTCLAALELFASNSENNHVSFRDPMYDELLIKLGEAKSSASRRKYCGLALERLLSSHKLIPLGRFQFFMVLKPDYTGLEMNELFQMNLSNLRPVSL